MALDETLSAHLRDAMRANDAVRRETIRQLRSTLHNEVIAHGKPLTDDQEITVVQRLINQHRDSITEFSKGGRADLVAREQAELEILQGYMPIQMDREAIADLARAAIVAVQATSKADQGKVMRELAALRGKADMRLVNEVVQELLS